MGTAGCAMSKELIVAFLEAAIDVCGCQRGLAVDDQMNILTTINLSEEVRQTARFNILMSVAVRKSIDSNEAVITNNVVTSVDQAPLTNTSFSDLRMVVAIPLEGMGAIYMDKSVKQGVIPRPMVDTLYDIAQDLVKVPPLEANKEAIIAQYKQRV
jgi:hypothetical protein